MAPELFYSEVVRGLRKHSLHFGSKHFRGDTFRLYDLPLQPVSNYTRLVDAVNFSLRFGIWADGSAYDGFYIALPALVCHS